MVRRYLCSRRFCSVIVRVFNPTRVRLKLVHGVEEVKAVKIRQPKT